MKTKTTEQIYLDTFEVMEGEAIALKCKVLSKYIYEDCMDFLQNHVHCQERFAKAEELISKFIELEFDKAGNETMPENLRDIVRFSIFLFTNDGYSNSDGSLDTTVFEDPEYIEEQEEIEMYLLIADEMPEKVNEMRLVAMRKSYAFGYSCTVFKRDRK